MRKRRGKIPAGTVERGERKLWNVGRVQVGLLRFDIGRLDHLGPLLGIVGDVFPEFGGRHRHRHAAKIGKSCLHLRIGKAALISVLS